MLKIQFNQELLDRHIEEINIKLLTKINSVKTDNLSKKTLCCLSEIEKNSKLILKANPKELKEIIGYFSNNFCHSIGHEQNKSTELYETLCKIFTDKSSGLYKNFTNYKKQYDAYEFVTTLDIKTCPYCNRNYTFIVDEDNGKLRPEIDHFFPKSKYPFLAMSFFNLIPSCTICNHTKSSIDRMELKNPYDIKSEDFKFTYVPTSVEFANIENKKYDLDNFEIELSGDKANIEVFKLKELYKQHKDIVLELLIKKAYYPKSYVKELQGFGFSQDEIYRYLFSNYSQEKDLHKRPLSKLIKDISEELELI